MRAVEILGVGVDDVTMAEAADRVTGFLRAPRCHQIATVNPEFVIIARHNREFARVLAESELNLPDGANLLRAARFLGQPLRDRVGGSDLIWVLAERAAKEGWRIFLLGGRENVSEKAAQKLCARYPNLRVVGTFEGSPDPINDDAILQRVNASRTDILFVAYGAPAQDLWIARNRARLDARVAMGVGGAFDFIAGRIPRAPVWIQRAGFEWLYRLFREPWRWRRQLALIEFVRLVLMEKTGHTQKKTSRNI